MNLTNKMKKQLEDAREKWKKVAKEYNWYKEPFYIQAWFSNEELIDAVSTKALTKDIILEA